MEQVLILEKNSSIIWHLWNIIIHILRLGMGSWPPLLVYYIIVKRNARAVAQH